MSEVKDLLEKDRYSFEDLQSIMKILRSENGCPWDKEQNFKSIRNNIIEEVYEFVEGVDTDNKELMCEELGDVLLQIVFHAEMAREENSFTINEVCDGICKKLILRHPHIFADTVVSGSGDVLKNWDSIKMVEKGQKNVSDQMSHISKALPSLIRSSKIGQKAAKVGFDFSDAKEALVKVKEELSEVEVELEKNDEKATFEEFGDLLFSVVNAARLAGINAEEALYFANEKFLNRFSKLENEIEVSGKNFSELSLTEMDQIWNRIKIKC